MKGLVATGHVAFERLRTVIELVTPVLSWSALQISKATPAPKNTTHLRCSFRVYTCERLTHDPPKID